MSLPGGPADGKLGVPAPASPTDLPSGSGVPALPSVSGGKLTGVAKAKANLQKLLAMLKQIKAKHGAAGGKGATDAKIEKVSFVPMWNSKRVFGPNQRFSRLLSAPKLVRREAPKASHLRRVEVSANLRSNEAAASPSA